MSLNYQQNGSATAASGPFDLAVDSNQDNLTGSWKYDSHQSRKNAHTGVN